MKRLLLSLLLLVPATNMFAEQPVKQEKKPYYAKASDFAKASTDRSKGKEQPLSHVVAKTALGVGALALSVYAGYKAYDLYQENPIFTPTPAGKTITAAAAWLDKLSENNFRLTEKLNDIKFNYAIEKLKPVVAWGVTSYASAVIGLVSLFRAAK